MTDSRFLDIFVVNIHTALLRDLAYVTAKELKTHRLVSENRNTVKRRNMFSPRLGANSKTDGIYL